PSSRTTSSPKSSSSATAIEESSATSTSAKCNGCCPACRPRSSRSDTSAPPEEPFEEEPHAHEHDENGAPVDGDPATGSTPIAALASSTESSTSIPVI